MLKTLDFVDPFLAERIQNLEQEMNRLEISRLQIMGNHKLLPSTRQKLLRYQSDCEINTKKMLQQQRDKLAEYLDKQTNVITKRNREGNDGRPSTKLNATCNQSTRIDFSMDETKSMETTTNKLSKKLVCQISKYQKQIRSGNRNRHKVKRLTKKVEQQQKLINMLVTWVKIYHEKQLIYQSNGSDVLVKQNQELCQINQRLTNKCQLLENQLTHMKAQFKTVSENILDNYKKFESLRTQNDGLKMQRKELLQTVRSNNKNSKTAQSFV